MSVRVERNWMGVFELRYKCPKCNCTLTSFKKEIEEGKDTCPECGNVITFPSSLPAKFDAAEKEHNEAIATRIEAKRKSKAEKKEQKLKQESERLKRKTEKAEDWERWRARTEAAMRDWLMIGGVLVVSGLIIYPTFWCVNMLINELFDTDYAKQYHADSTANANIDWQSMGNTQRAERQEARVRKALNENFVNAKGTGVLGTYEHKRVPGGYVTEIEGENAFGGTVRNRILTTDNGKQINLSVP